MKIDDLKTLLNFKISDGRNKIPVYINESRKSPINIIVLFYNNDNDYVSETKAAYYSNGIQIVCRHNDYNKARSMSYDIVEYIRANRKTISGAYWMPELPPYFTGVDELTGGYTWSAEIKMKGGE